MRVIGNPDLWDNCGPPTHTDIEELANEIWVREGKLENVARQNWHHAEIMLWLAYAEKVRRALKIKDRETNESTTDDPTLG